MKRMLLAGIAITTLAGCLSMIPISYVATGATTYAALADECPVRVYLTKAPEKFEELGVAEVQANSLEWRVKAVKKKACEVGGNGIIGQGETTLVTSSTQTNHHTASTPGGSVNYATTTPTVSTAVVQKFIIIRTPE